MKIESRKNISKLGQHMGYELTFRLYTAIEAYHWYNKSLIHSEYSTNFMNFLEDNNIKVSTLYTTDKIWLDHVVGTVEFYILPTEIKVSQAHLDELERIKAILIKYFKTT